MTCRQCAKNLAEDDVEPDCDSCSVSEWDQDTKILFVIYDRVCPWGELDYHAFKNAFNDLEIPIFKRASMRRNLVVIHREIKKHQQEQQQQPTNPET